ncbi:MAG: hypothetical protein ACTSSP_03215 [Candidatus Asgardarchaeia archaeon]
MNSSYYYPYQVKPYSTTDHFKFGINNFKNAIDLAVLVFFYNLIINIPAYFAFLQLFHGFHLSVKFTFPWTFPTLSNLYDYPESVSPFLLTFTYPSILTIIVSRFMLTILGIWALSFIIFTILESAFMGVIYSRIFSSEKIGFFDSVNKYFIRFVLFKLIIMLISLPYLIIFFVMPSIFHYFPSGFYFLAILTPIAFLLVSYLFFLTPYIIVSDDKPLAKALSMSASYTLTSHTFSYVIVFVIFTAITSVIISALMHIPIVGFIISLGIVSYIGTAFVISTFNFYEDLKRRMPFETVTV